MDPTRKEPESNGRREKDAWIRETGRAPGVPNPPQGDLDARFDGQAQEQTTSRTGDPPRSPRLLDRVRQEIRTRHYSRRTETAYVAWIKRFIFFHDKRHPNEMGEAEISGFVSHLATHKKVSASTQGQALAALLFPYKNVLPVS